MIGTCIIVLIIIIIVVNYLVPENKPKNEKSNINKESVHQCNTVFEEPVDKIDRLEQYYETQIELKGTHMISDFYQDCLNKLREIKKEKDNTTDILRSYAEYIKQEYDLATLNVDECWKENMVGTSRYSSMCLMQTWYKAELDNLISYYGARIGTKGEIYIC